MKTEQILLSNLLAINMRNNRDLQSTVCKTLDEYEKVGVLTEEQKILACQLQAGLEILVAEAIKYALIKGMITPAPALKVTFSSVANGREYHSALQ